MNALDATRKWLREECPLIDKTDKFNANYLGSQATEYTLCTAGESHREDILGMDHATHQLTFVAQLPYGAAIKANIAAADFFANLAAWIRGANRVHNYPDIVGYEVEGIETANAGIPTGADANAARYQIFFGVFDSLHKKAADVLNGIKELVGNVVQGVKDLVSGLGDLGGAIANKVSSAWNAVTSGSPAQQSMESPLASLPVPALARGAVIPPNHRFLAMLGDQTNGTNVEAPLETIQEALAEVLAAQGGQDITIRFAGDLAQLVRLLNPYIDKENNRRGARLVSGGVY